MLNLSPENSDLSKKIEFLKFVSFILGTKHFKQNHIISAIKFEKKVQINYFLTFCFSSQFSTKTIVSVA